MVSTEITIKNQVGLHLRPAKDLCTAALKYHCKINIRKGNASYNAKSVLSILSACVKCGQKISIECDGVDEEEALEHLTALIETF